MSSRLGPSRPRFANSTMPVSISFSRVAALLSARGFGVFFLIRRRMPNMNVAGHSFEPPAGFRTEEMTVGLRLGLPGKGQSPSLVVQSRAARPGASLETLAAETMTELAQSVAQ